MEDMHEEQSLWNIQAGKFRSNLGRQSATPALAPVGLKGIGCKNG